MIWKSILIVQFLFILSAEAFVEDSTVNGQAKSSAHYDIVLTFGRCLAIPFSDVQTIANYDQAVDTGTMNGVQVDFTSRNSANAAYFHVPQSIKTADALAELKKWASPSQLGTQYVPAGLPVLTPQVSTMSGTLGAFGVYLHALGDKYSHLGCTKAGFIPHCGGPFPEACSTAAEYNYCHFREAHEDEFGTDPVLTNNTINGLTQVYIALSERYGKGTSVPLSIQSLIRNFSTLPAATDRLNVLANACR